MPHIDITMIPGRDDKTKQVLANKVQRFLAEELQIDPKLVSVSIEDVCTAGIRKVIDLDLRLPFAAERSFAL